MNIRKKLAAGIALPIFAAASGLALISPAAAASPMAAQGDAADARTIVEIARPASAAETAQLNEAAAKRRYGCNGGEASNNSYVHVCFKRKGDKLFVRDDEANGRSAVGQINFYDAGSRYNGYCLNPYTHASGKWVYCKFSRADENTTAYYRGYDTRGDSVGHFTAWEAERTS